MLNTNVGTIDRSLRIIVGLCLVGAFFYFPNEPWRYWTLIGIVPLVTGLVGNCPAYSIFGFSTCPIKKA